jgi:hypothetical protein
MVVAILALVVAASGTAVAASKLVNGDSLIRKGTLSGNRLRRHTLTGNQINLRRLGKVPSARHADRATSAALATNATHATNAINAINATNATNATNAINAKTATTANTATTATNATHATTADTATTANTATTATTAANLTGLTRFIKTIQPAGTDAATAAVVTLGTSGPLSLVGKCYTAGGAITGGLYLSTTAAAHYNAYDNQPNAAPLVPGTDEDVGYTDASATPPAVDLADPSDGTFAAITDDTGHYLTGLVSVGANLNSSGGCTFAGFTSAS